MNLAILFSIASALLNPATFRASPIIHGDYVEVRTASVFAGPCHFNGEVMTTGCDAILAWHFTSGSFNNINLTNLRAVAVITSDSNLSDSTAPRRSELVIDSAAAAQSAALIAALRSHFSQSLGQITSIRQEPILFVHYARQYRVTALNFATLSVQGMPNDECCKQPNLVWYSPLIPLDWRKVGYTQNAAYTAGTLTDNWQRADENDAFYGQFSLPPAVAR